MTQLTLFSDDSHRTIRTFDKLRAPLAQLNLSDCFSREARFFFWCSNAGEICVLTMNATMSFWKDEKTPDGELLRSPHGLPDREKALINARYAKHEAESRKRIRSTAPKPRKRKSGKWSDAAKGRVRRRNLRKRLEKQFGYDSEKGNLFRAELEAKIEMAYCTQLTELPDYYAGKTKPFDEMYHLTD